MLKRLGTTALKIPEKVIKIPQISPKIAISLDLSKIPNLGIIPQKWDRWLRPPPTIMMLSAPRLACP